MVVNYNKRIRLQTRPRSTVREFLIYKIVILILLLLLLVNSILSNYIKNEVSLASYGFRAVRLRNRVSSEGSQFLSRRIRIQVRFRFFKQSALCARVDRSWKETGNGIRKSRRTRKPGRRRPYENMTGIQRPKYHRGFELK